MYFNQYYDINRTFISINFNVILMILYEVEDLSSLQNVCSVDPRSVPTWRQSGGRAIIILSGIFTITALAMIAEHPWQWQICSRLVKSP